MARDASTFSDVLSPLTLRKDVSAAISQIRSQIDAFPDTVRCRHKIGYPGAAGDSRLTWISKLRFWICVETYEVRGDRHWIAYGVVDPTLTKKALNIRVETSLPHLGVNRRIAGLLATDEGGNSYLLHSGKIGGGKKGFGKTFFWKHYRGDRTLVRFEDGDREYALIGRIDASDFAERLGDFVHGVDALRSGNLKYIWRFPTGSGLRPFAKKGGGKSKAEITKTIIIRNRAHDEVLNALKAHLDRHPSVASIREDLRDLHVTLTNGTELDVEVKVRTDRYEIYTAVGQLLLNQDKTRLVLVAPFKLADSADLIRRLRDLAISFVGFQGSGERLSFSGLDTILAPAK